MGSIFSRIKEQTKTMGTKQKIEYILTYYWYHILGICVLVGLVIFLIVHFAFPEEKPLFTCVLVNQKTDYEQDEKFAEAFAKSSGISQKEVVFDSDYIISYDGNKQEGTNESSFDKFFFKWSGGELDAVVMNKEFLKYCIKVGGEFYPVEEFDTGNLSICDVDGVGAIELKDTVFGEKLEDEKEELIVVFPETGEHLETCQKFVDYLKENQ